MKYIIKLEYRDTWNTINDVSDDTLWIVDKKEIEHLAVAWGVTIEKLMQEVEPWEG
jgi:hypothetical protein